MIWFNGFPFLDNKEEHSFGVPVSQVMTSNLRTLATSGMLVRDVERLLQETTYSGFPIVDDDQSKVLLGYIGRTELRFAIDRARKKGLFSSNAQCSFTAQPSEDMQTPPSAHPPVTFEGIASSAGQQVVDFSQVVDLTPIAVHPRLPLETVMELFKKMGPRVILVEHHGQLHGLVTVKDCLKYQFKAEAQEHLRDDGADGARQERLWEAVQRTGDWMAERVSALSLGRLTLPPRTIGSSSGWPPEGDGIRSSWRASTQGREAGLDGGRAILDGTEDLGRGVELDDR